MGLAVRLESAFAYVFSNRGLGGKSLSRWLRIPLFVPALDDGPGLWPFRTNYMSRTNLRPPGEKENREE